MENDRMQTLGKKFDPNQCRAYKKEVCNPKKVKFNACLTCPNCKALLVEQAVPAVFNRIIALAGMFMSVFGLYLGNNNTKQKK